ncbi:hypothetical protein Tsubulata_030215, partial [Turnera subulata]
MDPPAEANGGARPLPAQPWLRFLFLVLFSLSGSAAVLLLVRGVVSAFTTGELEHTLSQFGLWFAVASLVGAFLHRLSLSPVRVASASQFISSKIGDKNARQVAVVAGVYYSSELSLRWVKNQTAVVSWFKEPNTLMLFFFFATYLMRSDLDHLYEKITELVRALELGRLKQDIANANKKKEFALKAIQSKEKWVADVRNQIDQVRASVATKEAEMDMELIDHLTPEEKGILSQFNPEIQRDKEDLIKVRAEHLEAESKKAELETNLTTNLKQQQALEAIISSEESGLLPCVAELKSQELRDAKSLVETTLRQLKSVLDTIEERSRELERIKDERIELLNLEYDYFKALKDEKKQLLQLSTKSSIFLARQEEYSNKIRGLGSFSAEAFETHKQRNIKELYRMLDRCNGELKKFSHVNKKALDQYVNFTEQREELQKKGKLNLMQATRELISLLDQWKDKSIERTFKGVAHHFREVFSELVQGGV